MLTADDWFEGLKMDEKAAEKAKAVEIARQFAEPLQTYMRMAFWLKLMGAMSFGAIFAGYLGAHWLLVPALAAASFIVAEICYWDGGLESVTFSGPGPRWRRPLCVYLLYCGWMTAMFAMGRIGTWLAPDAPPGP